ncbi:hypothetical protein ACFL5F_07235 [Planctomycetota bacterium]
MCRKLVLLVSFVLVLSLSGSVSAELPDGWQSQDIGTTGGSTDVNDGTWTVTGAGDDVWGWWDRFHYAYLPLTGDGEISARVVDNGIGSDPWAKGGVMIRETLADNSKHAIMTITGGEGGGIAFQCRPDTGGASFSSHGNTFASPPYWVKLKREGNTITGYSSQDGITWVQQPSVTGGDGTTNPVEIEMAGQVYIGLFVTSHAGSVVRTYTFDNVNVELPLLAYNPSPGNGAIYLDTWAGMSWKAGLTAVSHDIYFGENTADVEAGTGDTFRGNQILTYFIVGITGYPYPDGLVPGTTYYWRVDEVEADGVTRHTGDLWSFTVPPKKAYNPVPADNAPSVEVEGTNLVWTAGLGASLYTVYFGDNFDDVSNAAGSPPLPITTYTPGPLNMAKTYYWRVDEFAGGRGAEMHKGDVWSFTTEGAVGSPSPANGAVNVTQTATLSWSPGIFGTAHDIYFDTNKEAVRNADTSSPEYKGSGNTGSESYDPGKLDWNTTYYWRVDETNNANADSPWTGPVWSFTTADFLIVDDFESYDDLYPDHNRIFRVWIDGLDNPSINGSVVGYDSPPFAEQTIVHSGNQSMPMSYDNAVGISEATKTLIYPRDWTENGVDTLVIWYIGDAANAAEPMYVALNDSAVVTNNNPNATQVNEWTQWNIDLKKFADQGLDLTDVNSIALGLGNRSNPVAGGSGMMYFDDIRLYPPAP